MSNALRPHAAAVQMQVKTLKMLQLRQSVQAGSVSCVHQCKHAWRTMWMWMLHRDALLTHVCRVDAPVRWWLLAVPGLRAWVAE